MSTLTRLVLMRLSLGLATLTVVSLIVYGAIDLLPGDAAEEILGQARTPETVAALRRELGLDLPFWQRYLAWMGNLLQGDLGRSQASSLPVSELVGRRIGNTLFLAAYAALIAVPLSLGLGILAALHRGRAADHAINTGALSAIALPEFLVAYLLIFVFAVEWRLFPSLSRVGAHMDLSELLLRTTLPALTLTLAVSAHMIRMTRAALVNILASPYVEMARLKGAPPFTVILRHALPNALAPIISVVALNLAYLVVGVVVVEVIFVYPGLGQLLVDSVAKRDIVTVQAVSLLFAAAFVILNMIADVLAIATTPRLLHGR